MEDKIYQGYNLDADSCEEQPKNWTSDSPEGCMKLCRNQSNCFKFTWIANAPDWKAGNKRCCLKDQRRMTNATLTPRSGRISGPEDCGIIFTFMFNYKSSNSYSDMKCSFIYFT